MDDELIKIDTAILATSLGFNVGYSIFCYEMEWLEGTDMIKIPVLDATISFDIWKTDFRISSQSLLQRWLREVHDTHLEPETEGGEYRVWLKSYKVNKQPERYVNNGEYFKSYETALEAGLIEALKLIENETTSLHQSQE